MTADAHLRLSIAMTAVFVAIGLALEATIGLRAAGLVDDPLRRELLRLGHAHGGVLGLLNVAASWAMLRLDTPEPWARRIRPALWGAALLVAGGFIGGGLWRGPHDPGPIVLLVPAGAVTAIVALAAIAVLRSRR